MTTKPTPVPAVEAALAMLRAHHEARCSALADELADEFRLGRLHGLREEDRGAVMFRLEKLAGARLASTPRDAAIVLLASPTKNPCSEGDLGGLIDVTAEVKAAWDVLRAALVRGYYRPARGEEPTAAQLLGPRRAGRRAA